jgi:SAM-dependent methyltransferase
LVADGYDRLHDVYASWGGAEGGGLRRRYIDRAFEQGLGRPARALDLGCGTGRHATAYLIERGLAVTGVDISPATVAAARRAIPGAEVLVGDMAALQFPPRSFDLVTAFYSILHVPRHEHRGLLARIATWLRPGGCLVATLGGGARGGEGIDKDWLGVADMYWSNWDLATNRRLVADAGLHLLEANREPQEEDGRVLHFLWVLAQKPSEDAGETPGAGVVPPLDA